MKRVLDYCAERLEQYRLHLGSSQANGFLALLGLLSGVAAGLMIIAFRACANLIQHTYMPDLPNEAFEILDPAMHFAVPVIGAVVLALAYWLIPASARVVGVVHVLERLHYHQGHMPLRNLLVQFFGGAAALASGHSVGREGPSVHIGAAIAALLGQRLQLPNNSIRTLVACGTAAAIAASFNTPLAGVVFAMEVIMVEYTIAGFVPVILAAVAATALTREAFGADTTFLVPLLGLASQWELAYITVMGVTVGTLSAAFVKSVRWLSTRIADLHLGVKFIGAGCATGALALLAPQVLGLGYDTVSATLAGQCGLAALAVIFDAKFAATVVCISARIPGGLIGPTVLLGCLAGGVYADLIHALPGVGSESAIYVMLGMAAMMAAVLQAPLAALLALLEMTGNPHIIMPAMPAMLAVVAAALTARIGFKQESVFTHLMRDSGLDYRHDSVSQGLRRIGVAAVMNRSFETCARSLPIATTREILLRGPQWLVIEGETERPQLLLAADLARYYENHPGTDSDIDLLAIPAERCELKPVHLQATLFEARSIMVNEGVEALYVRRPLAPLTFRTFGVIRRADVEAGVLT